MGMLEPMKSYSKSNAPSFVTLPDGNEFSTVFSFMLFRFPRIQEPVWRERIECRKVHFDDGEPIRLTTPYQPRRRVCYYREVENETKIPFEEEILFENDDIIVVDKPHFLPVHPAGKYVNETLISRMRIKCGAEELSSAHRIDRLTAGVVLCIKTRSKRGLYQKLFMSGAVEKTYFAAGKLPQNCAQTHWHIRARMEPRADYFRMQIVAHGPTNSESIIELIECHNGVGLFRLRPITGKKHQLRVHLCEMGSGILNDPLYPNYLKENPIEDYTQPMQLLAQRLAFIDPTSGKPMEFKSKKRIHLHE